MSAAAAATFDRRAAPISQTTADGEILVRGRSLARELMGHVSFTEMLLLDLNGVLPSRGHALMVETILVTLMEHGITPSTLATRMVVEGAPESLPAAVAAGLLATGTRFLGTIEDAAGALVRIVAAREGGATLDAAATAEARGLVGAGRRIPGLGHNLHADADPRVPVLRELAERDRIAGAHVEALDALAAAATRERGDRPLVVNAAGMIAAILCDLGYAVEHVRGFALVARCAGLFAHAVDEREAPIARGVWESAHHSTPDGAGASDRTGPSDG